MPFVFLLLVAAPMVLLGGTLAAAAPDDSPGATETILYNGIRQAEPWPPEYREMSRDKPAPVPYLDAPPAVIPIDVGRQLFVDDFLIESTSLHRVFHKADFYENNPVLRPDRPWEHESSADASRPASAANPFSDGVWYDPRDQVFKMWYSAGYYPHRCYATSHDGIDWVKPDLGVVPGTNIFFAGCDTSTVWLDLEEQDPAKRFKLWREDRGILGLGIYYSADGIHWGKPLGRTGSAPSPCTVFWNPFRGVWVYSMRASCAGMGRYRRYWETRDPLVGIHWDALDRPEVGPQSKGPMRLPLWVWADKFDHGYADSDFPAELYNLDAVAYESIMLGMFSMMRQDTTDQRPKVKEQVLGYSRDGFHWHRPDRESFIGVSDDLAAWNAGNIQSAGGCCLVVGDQLYFYVSGRRYFVSQQGEPRGEYTTGLATLRRDGFASMGAGKSGGTLTTRPVTFGGKHLFVNFAAAAGELQVELLDAEGRVMEPFGRAQCIPLRGDRTLQQVRWRTADDLSSLAGRPVKFRFHLTDGKLYAFWVSPERSGASHGYVAAGGPGFTGPTDTVGRPKGP